MHKFLRWIDIDSIPDWPKPPDAEIETAIRDTRRIMANVRPQKNGGMCAQVDDVIDDLMDVGHTRLAARWGLNRACAAGLLKLFETKDVFLDLNGNPCTFQWVAATSQLWHESEVETPTQSGGDDSPPAETDKTGDLKKPEPAARKAYLSFQYAESIAGRQLEDNDAYNLLNENGIDQDRGNIGELMDYELPLRDTWKRQLRNARNVLGEQKNTSRAERKTGRSIVKSDDI